MPNYREYAVRDFPDLIMREAVVDEMTVFTLYRNRATRASLRQRSRLFGEIRAWCYDQFGEKLGENDSVRWGEEENRIFIVSGIHATAFKIRWC